MNKRILIAFATILVPIISRPAFAQMENSSYILDTEVQPKTQQEKIEKTKEVIEKSQIIKGNTYTAILESNSDGKKEPFLFTISDNIIDFGNVKPGEPLTRTQIISVTPGSANQFQVVAYETHPLRSSEKYEIANTSCDNGNCTNILSDTWTLPLTYGFGYRCENIENQACVAGIDNTLYKRFSNLEANESPSIIMRSTNKNKSSSLIEYKLNIAGTQQSGSYNTTVMFLASPIL